MDRFLLVTHGLVAALLAGVLVHEAVWSSRYLRGGFASAPRERWFLRLAGGLFFINFLVGCLVYPTYKVHVRGAYLDLHRPDIARLFDIKEHLLAWVLATVIALLLLDRFAPPARHRQRLLIGLYCGLSTGSAVLVIVAVAIGLLTATFEGLPL